MGRTNHCHSFLDLSSNFGDDWPFYIKAALKKQLLKEECSFFYEVTFMSAHSTLYGVLGLGRSGMGAVKFLVHQGHTVVVWDDRGTIRDQMKERFGECVQVRPVKEWEGIHKIVLSPGIPPHHAEVQRLQAEGVSCLTEVDLFLDSHPDAKVIAVTGTNGKSTLVALIDHVLGMAGIPVASGGNLGTPCVELPTLSKEGVYVLELSSYQLHWLKPHSFLVSCITNITPDHLEWHGDWNSYVHAKLKISEKAEHVVLGSENLELPWHNLILDRRQEPVEIIRSLKIENLARACLKPFKLSESVWDEALATFKGLPHRQELITGPGRSLLWVNDSKATNVAAAHAALKAYKEYSIFWIAGGQAKKGDRWDNILPEEADLQGVFLYGESGDVLKEAFMGKGLPFVQTYSTLEEATLAAWQKVQDTQKECSNPKKTVVLLSPGGASFDQFKNFEERGEMFRKIVQTLPQCRGIREQGA
jgi:UDP-N-acetylmuramoylalanine--D-glutamate ligase